MNDVQLVKNGKWNLHYSIAEEPIPMANYGEMGFLTRFQSLRKCPGCGYWLNTDGHGRFNCPRCGREDTQDVSKLIEAGLDYNAYIPKKMVMRRKGVG